jgi:outer membrane immunogenic protein
MKLHLRAFLTSLAITLAAGPVLAEDLMPPVTEPSFDWTGFYVGVNGGYNWGQLDISDNSVTTSGPLVGFDEGDISPAETFTGEDSSTSIDGWLGGAQIGYNHQMGLWVIGIEADFQGLDFEDSDSFLGSIAGPYYETASEINAFGTVRGRAGYAFDNVLLFVTGGLAGAESEAHLAIQGGVPGAFTGPRFSDSQTESMLGYVIGGGLEWAIADSAWSVKAEYLHVDFGSERYAFSFAGTGGDTATSDGEVTLDIARVGVNFAF